MFSCPLRAGRIRPVHSPHVSQELLQFLLSVDGPEFKAAGGVAGVTDALVQRPVLIQHQPQTDTRGQGSNTLITHTVLPHACLNDIPLKICERWQHALCILCTLFLYMKHPNLREHTIMQKSFLHKIRCKRTQDNLIH